MPALRVVLVSASPAGRNGRVAHMAAGLMRAGCRVTLIAGAGAPLPDNFPADLPVLHVLPPEVDRGGRFDDPAGEALKALSDAHVVHASGQGALAWALRGMGERSALIYDVPGDIPAPVGTGGGLLARAGALKSEAALTIAERKGAARAVAITCVGYTFGEFLQRELKLGKVPVVPIYPALPLVDAIPPVVLPGATGNFPKVVIPGGDFAGMETGVRAVARMRRVELVIAGGHGDYAPVTAWAREERAEGRVIRLDDPPGGMLATVAACQAALVLPSDTSPRALHDLPDALFVCIMAETPMVASELPGVERIVGRNALGMLAAPDDVELIADTAGRIATDRPTRERYQHNLKVVREKRYCWQVQEERLVALYRQLFAASGVETAVKEQGV
ncbi:MAG: glycosyltransferase family 4 protein [Nitrospirota bacterium]|nr:glycosyltransferase family 4 protein [Nitrospirota bacterium]